MTRKRRSMPHKVEPVKQTDQTNNQPIKQPIDDSFELPADRPSRTVMSLMALISVVCICAIISQSFSQPINPNLTNQPANPQPVIRGPQNPVLLSLDSTDARVLRDAQCFTQGIEYHTINQPNNQSTYLYESCGMYGSSYVIKRDASTGKMIKKVALDRKLFAEGLTILNDKVYVLTWRERVCLVYDLDLQPINQFTYKHDGWGITHFNNELLVTDGSDKIRFYDENFKLLRTLSVRAYDQSNQRYRAIKNLNELEMIDGYLWANQWMANVIHVIDVQTGVVKASIDCTKLVDVAGGDTYEKVLNGIALNPVDHSILVTGKYWSLGFIIEKPVIAE